MILPNKLTPISKAEAIDTFRNAWKYYWGQDPTRNQLAMICAHAWIETGFKSIHNWNFGNVKGKPDATDYDVQFYRCSEYINGVVQYFDPPSPVCCFRAYRDPVGGAKAHVTFLAEGRYSGCLDSMRDGDPAAFAHALRVAGYYTDLEAHYTAMIQSAFVAFRAMILVDAGEAITFAERQTIMFMVGQSLQDLRDDALA